MCYDSDTSLKALVINIISSIILIYYSYKFNNLQIRAIACFFLFVGGMQMWDYIFWNYGPDTIVNQSCTKAAMIWNHLEPIILGLVIIFIMKEKFSRFSSIIFYSYVLSAIGYSIYSYGKIKTTQPTEETKGSLYWEWNHMPFQMVFYGLFFITLLVLFYSHFTGWIRNFSLIVCILSFFFSMYKYAIKNSTGRFWCYFAAFAPIFYILMLQFFIRDYKR